MFYATPIQDAGRARFAIMIGVNQSSQTVLSAYLAANGWRGEREVHVTIAAGVQLASASTSLSALKIDKDQFAPGTRIFVEGQDGSEEICGKGGAYGTPGGAGGDALEITADDAVFLALRLPGEKNGGGGGGGNGEGNRRAMTYTKGCSGACCGNLNSGGAGGAGYGPGAQTSGSAGSTWTCSGLCPCTGGVGGAGGGKGAAGSSGAGVTGNCCAGAGTGPYGGGAAGRAIVGTANVDNWINKGTVNGSEV